MSRQKEEKHGQEEERKSERVRMPPLFICNTVFSVKYLLKHALHEVPLDTSTLEYMEDRFNKVTQM